MIFCTQLTFDIFLRLRSNYRFGIHPYVICHISRNNISMGRIIYSILPSKVKISVFFFFSMGLPTITWHFLQQFSPWGNSTMTGKYAIFRGEILLLENCILISQFSGGKFKKRKIIAVFPGEGGGGMGI